MLTALVISLILLISCVMLHFEVLQTMDRYLPCVTWMPARMRVVAALFGAVASHLLQIALYGLAYFLLRDKMGLGQFGGQFEDVYSSFLYFSAETYSTLGLGDIYPLGSLRLVLGLETLTGLLMISWTASFTYLEMRRHWDPMLPRQPAMTALPGQINSGKPEDRCTQPSFSEYELSEPEIEIGARCYQSSACRGKY